MKMFMCRVLVVLTSVLYGCAPARNPEAETAAVKAAQEWLALIDGGDYVISWAESAPLLKAAVPQDQWDKMMDAARKPFGKKLSREKISSVYKTAMPGAPDGEYVIIQFKASFENKKSAVETVTPMKDQEGTWRVSGYYIK